MGRFPIKGLFVPHRGPKSPPKLQHPLPKPINQGDARRLPPGSPAPPVHTPYSSFVIFLFASFRHDVSSSSLRSTLISRYKLTTIGKPRLAIKGVSSSIMRPPFPVNLVYKQERNSGRYPVFLSMLKWGKAIF